MLKKLARFAPPGFPLREERIFYNVALIAAVLWSLTALAGIFTAASCFPFTGVMPPFTVCMESRMVLFWVPVGVSLIYIPVHYFYYYSRSRSINLMRRLPDRGLLLRQCVTLPLWGILFTVLLTAVILGIYYGIYLIAAPRGLTPAGQWREIWRAFYA